MVRMVMSVSAVSFLYCVSQKILSGLLFFCSRTSHTAILGGFSLRLYSTSQFAEQFPRVF